MEALSLESENPRQNQVTVEQCEWFAKAFSLSKRLTIAQAAEMALHQKDLFSITKVHQLLFFAEVAEEVKNIVNDPAYEARMIGDWREQVLKAVN